MVKNLNIGIALSGGGFRSASFNLGVLSYLDRIEVDNESLLKKVKALSTVSGGTITGARYVLGIHNKERFDKTYKSLYNFMNKIDLVSLGLGKLVSKSGWGGSRIKSLINAFADVYDKELFDYAKFGKLFTDDLSIIHLKHLSFNATEFATALQFRFQWSEKILKPKPGEPDRGIIGNYYYRIPDHIAKHIRMADILAASSCFPGGFEPINFPNDFVLPENLNLSEVEHKEGLEIGLMDGGIVDNQGIEPILLADTRMKRNIKDENPEQDIDSHALDLIIVSDVTSPYMKEYLHSEQKNLNWWRRLTPFRIITLNTLLLLVSGIGLYYSLINKLILFIVLASGILTLNLIIYLLVDYLLSFMGRIEILKPFKKPLSKLLKLRLLIYENLITNRAKSILKMTGDVFLKHVRRLNYEKIFADPTWKNRRIMNAIYELKPGEKKLQEKIDANKISDYLIPAPQMQDVAEKASNMSTTLWFTKDEIDEKKVNMLNSLIACGQFTICWNLLEYIEKLEKDKSNTNENHRQFFICKGQLLNDWEKFKIDPYWLVNELNSKYLKPKDEYC